MRCLSLSLRFLFFHEVIPKAKGKCMNNEMAGTSMSKLDYEIMTEDDGWRIEEENWR